MFLTQQNYIKRILLRLDMYDSKPILTPLASHFRLSIVQCPQTDKQQQEMTKIPCSIAVRSHMYAMVLTRPKISHVASLGIDHWRTVK